MYFHFTHLECLVRRIFTVYSDSAEACGTQEAHILFSEEVERRHDDDAPVLPVLHGHEQRDPER